MANPILALQVSTLRARQSLKTELNIGQSLIPPPLSLCQQGAEWRLVRDWPERLIMSIHKGEVSVKAEMQLSAGAYGAQDWA
ncbi:hypothetical protein NQZ68_008445 [Dissostichus eleginoides]|nr:hypothetical protein NQZ68_008445 [Dissostichus eleginoides]